RCRSGGLGDGGSTVARRLRACRGAQPLADDAARVVPFTRFQRHQPAHTAALRRPRRSILLLPLSPHPGPRLFRSGRGSCVPAVHARDGCPGALGGGLVDRFGARWPLIVGPALTALGFVLLGSGEGPLSAIVLPMSVLALGMAITVAPLTT